MGGLSWRAGIRCLHQLADFRLFILYLSLQSLSCCLFIYLFLLSGRFLQSLFPPCFSRFFNMSYICHIIISSQTELKKPLCGG